MCWGGYAKKGSFVHFGEKMKPLWKTTEVLQKKKIKNRTTTWSSNFTSGYGFKGNRNTTWKDICTPIFIVALFTTVKTWRQYNRILFSYLKKKAVLPSVTIQMNFEGIMISEVDRERQILYDLIYVWIYTNQQKTNLQNRLVVANTLEAGGKERAKWVKVVERY